MGENETMKRTRSMKCNSAIKMMHGPINIKLNFNLQRSVQPFVSLVSEEKMATKHKNT